MKLTSIEIHPLSGDPVILSFRDPRALNPYNVKSILGLDSDLIIPRQYGASEIAKFYNLAVQKRTVVIQAGLNPDFSTSETYSDLRDAMYRLIASSRAGEIELRFKNVNAVVASAFGFITKLETDPFEKVQEVQLTVRLNESMLKSISPINVDIFGLSPANTIIEDDVSTSPHGFGFSLNIDEDIDNVTIANPDLEAVRFFTINPPAGFLAGDILSFNSEPNNKQLYVTRSGEIIHLADVVALGSIWPIMFPGTNTFYFTNADFVSWDSISYYETHWGV